MLSLVSFWVTLQNWPKHCIVPEYTEATAVSELVVPQHPCASHRYMYMWGVSLVFSLSLLPSRRATQAQVTRCCSASPSVTPIQGQGSPHTMLKLCIYPYCVFKIMKILFWNVYFIYILGPFHDGKCYFNFCSFIIWHCRVVYKINSSIPVLCCSIHSMLLLCSLIYYCRCLVTLNISAM